MKKQSKPTHTERLTIRVSHELFEQIRRRAKEKELSVSSYVRATIKDDIKKN